MDMNYYVLTFSIPNAGKIIEVQSRGYFDNLETAINKFEESHPGKVCTLTSCISEMCNWKTLDKLNKQAKEMEDEKEGNYIIESFKPYVVICEESKPSIWVASVKLELDWITGKGNSKIEALRQLQLNFARMKTN